MSRVFRCIESKGRNTFPFLPVEIFLASLAGLVACFVIHPFLLLPAAACAAVGLSLWRKAEHGRENYIKVTIRKVLAAKRVYRAIETDAKNRHGLW